MKIIEVQGTGTPVLPLPSTGISRQQRSLGFPAQLVLWIMTVFLGLCCGLLLGASAAKKEAHWRMIPADNEARHTLESWPVPSLSPFPYAGSPVEDTAEEERLRVRNRRLEALVKALRARGAQIQQAQP